ncbi:MAG: TonB-dependent receptor [bacterium]|nr:TonB-dependent receptor [bacterium]
MIKLRYFILLGFFGLLAISANAQSGKIQGKVTEVGTGEPLTGATVAIQGTTRGVLVDIDGNYVILNVPPGTYTLEARFIGFAAQVIENVVVRTDLTTEIDFELREEVFEGEEIVVQAERPVIIKDLTASESRVSSEEIASLPVQEVTDVIQLQAGVNISNNGAIHIRGGRASEVSYVVDGIRTTDDYDRSQGLRIENESIQELQVISGTFNAEHGQAMSGIVNVVTKAGSNDYEADFRVWGGSYLVSRPELYDGIGYISNDGVGDIDPTRMYNFSGSLSGPILRDKLTFFVTGRYFENKGWLTGRNAFNAQGPFSETINISQLDSYRTPYGETFDPSLPWFSVDTLGTQNVEVRDNGKRDSSLVNMNRFASYSFQGNLQYRVSNSLKFNLVSSYGNEEGRGYNHSRKLVPEGVNSFYRENFSVNLKTTITPSAKTFVTINTATTYNGFESYLYENLYDPRYFNYDQISDIETVFGGITPGQPFQFDVLGTDNSIFERSTRSFIAKAEVSSQVNDRHFVKAGINFQGDIVNFESINLQPLGNDGVSLPDGVPDDVLPFVQLGLPSLETTNYNRFERKPYNFSSYIQDKIEYDDFIVNVGLRFDFFQPNAQIPADPRDPDITNPILQSNIDLTREEREEIWWEDVDPKFQLSPRVGISYQVSEKGLLYFSYGYFFQMPSYEFLFTNSQVLLPESSGVFGIFGNPDLKPERSTQYELGSKFEIIEGTGLEVTGFYKDTRDYVSSGLVQPTYLGNVRYARWINRDYSISKGLTVALNQFVSQRINFGLDYTFNTVEGSNSDPAAEFNQAVSSGDLSGESLTKLIQPLDWDRTHIINGTMFYAGKNHGANVAARFLTGTPYTPSSPIEQRTGPVASVRDLRNTARYPVRFTIDINTFYNVDIAGQDMRIFLNIFNILDSQVVNSIYSDSGSPDFPLIMPITFDDTYFQDPSRFGEPRRIQLGIQLSF